MKKKFLWLLLFIPAIFVVASSPNTNNNDIGDENSRSSCAEYGGDTKQYNGNHGCPYTFDFTEQLNTECGSTLVDVDLDRGTQGIQHSVNLFSAHAYTGGNQYISMLPNSGYGGPGFTISFDITLYFEDANEVITTEDVTWIGYLDYYEDPYPMGCY